MRLISDFCIAAAADPSKLVPLKGKSKAPVVVRGTLVAPEEGKPKSKSELCSSLPSCTLNLFSVAIWTYCS